MEDYALFAEIVEAGSLSAAARRLRLSPAMVSKRLARMEARLGARLIQRTTRRLSPTEAGQRFYEEVARILTASRQAEALVGGLGKGPSGPLRISAPTSFGRMHVAPHIGGFLAAYPEIELDLQLTDDFVDLLGQRLDLVIRIGRPVQDGLAVHRLAANRRVLCAAPAYVAAHGQPGRLSDLAGHPVLAASGQLPWRLEGCEGARTIEGRSRVVTNSSEVVRELCLAGLGVALRSTWDVHAELGDGRLVRLLPDWEGASDVSIFIAHLPAQPTAAVSAFVAFAQALYATPSWER